MANTLDFTPEQIAAVQAHPDFYRAMHQDARTGIEFFDATHPFHQALNDMAGFVLGLIALSLDFTGGLTHRHLREGSGRGGLVSGGRATAILWRLRASRLVKPVESDDSGRPRAFAPDSVLVEIYRARFKLSLAAIGLIDPRVAEVGARLDDEKVFRAFVVDLTGGMISAAEKPDPMLQPINGLTMRSCGMLVLYHLIAGAFAAGADKPVGPTPLNITPLSRRLGVSRAHLYRYLDAMERGGLLRRGADPRTVRLTPVFADLYDRYYAIGVLGLGDSCDRVLERSLPPGSAKSA